VKVFWKEPARLLQIEAESAADLNALGSLLLSGPIKNAQWLKCPEDELPFACERGDGITSFMGGCAKVVGCVWDVACHLQQESEAQAGSQAISALRQMLGLGLGDPADDLATWATHFTGYVQAHKQLAARLEHLDAVLQALGVEVVNQKTMIHALMRTHSDTSLVVETCIVKE